MLRGTFWWLQSVLEKAKEKVGEYVKKAGEVFQEDGAVGKQFTPEGAAGDHSFFQGRQGRCDCSSLGPALAILTNCLPYSLHVRLE